jgi:hypothetical protein
MREAQWQREE